MARHRNPTPSYLPHASGRASAVWTDQAGVRHFRMPPGPHGSEERRAAFARLALELFTSPTRANATDDITVNELLAAHLRHAESYDRAHDGQPTGEVTGIERSVKPVREMCGDALASEFGPKALAAVREQMITAGRCWSNINRQINRVKRAVRWAVAEELVPPAVYEALRALPGLAAAGPTRRNRNQSGPSRMTW